MYIESGNIKRYLIDIFNHLGIDMHAMDVMRAVHGQSKLPGVKVMVLWKVK